MSYRKDRSTSLYVRNLSVDDLRPIFTKYGPVKDIYIPLDYFTKEVRGFAYVQYQDFKDAEDALYDLKNVKVNDRELEIEFAQGDRKTPRDMKTKDPRCSYRDDRYRRKRHRRSYSRESRSDSYGSRYSGSYSRSPSPHRSYRHKYRDYDREDSYSSRSRTESPHFQSNDNHSRRRHNGRHRSRSRH